MADLLDEGTKSDAIDSSVLSAKEMIPHLERAPNHPDMTPELAALLSPSQVELRCEIHPEGEIRD